MSDNQNPEMAPTQKPGLGRHALIVSNDRAQLAMIATLLVEDGWTVTRHARAETVLGPLRKSNLHPDLVVTDLFLPGMDGGSFIRLLRSKSFKNCNEVPVIVVSATFCGADSDKICRTLGSNAMLPIPFSESDFKEVVKRVIDDGEPPKKALFLVIDDDPGYVEILERFLNDKGYDVITKVSGEDLSTLKNKPSQVQHAPELILLDYHLPGIDGDSLLEKMLLENPHASIIMMSGDVDFDLAASWLGKGARAYCQKSMGLTYLLALCEKMLREKLSFDMGVMLERRTNELRRTNEKLLMEIEVRRMAERKLKEQARLLKETLDGIDDVIILMAPDYSVISMNKAAMNFYVKFGDAAGCVRCYELYGRSSPCKECHLDEVLRERRPATLEKFIPEVNAWVEMNSTPLLDENGKVGMVVKHLRDITARKKAEGRRLEEQRRLAQASKMAAMGTLVAGVAHEVNNPASVITLNAPLLKKFLDSALPVLDKQVAAGRDFMIDDMPYSAIREHLPSLISGIVNGGQRISKIVSHLKDFARPADCRSRQSVDLNDIVLKSVDLLRNPIKKATGSFVFNPEPSLPRLLNADPMQLEQVFVNLLLNSVQALPSPDKGIRVRTSFNAADNLFVLEIEDEGGGHPEGESGARHGSILHDQGDEGWHGSWPVDLAKHHQRAWRQA